MGLWAIFDPMVKNYFKDKYGESGGGSSGDYEALVNAMVTYGDFTLKSDTATRIDNDIFSNKNVVEIDFPNVTSVNSYSFTKCGYLTRVNIPKATWIGTEAFKECSRLPQVNLPKLGILTEGVFKNCDSLKKVDLGNVTQISAEAFALCDSLETVIIRTTSTVCVADLSAFNSTPIMQGTGHIYVPSAMYEHYRAGYEPAMNEAGLTGMFDIMFRKIEDYPEICG